LLSPISFIVELILLFKKGEEGPNKWGDPPRGDIGFIKDFLNLRKDSGVARGESKKFRIFLALVLFLTPIAIFTISYKIYEAPLKAELDKHGVASEQKSYFVNIKNGGSESEPLKNGGAVVIEWQACGDYSVVNLQIAEISKYKSALQYTIAEGLSGVGSYTYKIPTELPTGIYEVWVSAYGCTQFSKDYIYIKQTQNSLPEISTDDTKSIIEQTQLNDKFTFVKVTNGGSETKPLKTGDIILIQWQGCKIASKINLQIFVMGIYENGKVVPVEYKAGSYFVAQNIDNKGSGSLFYTITPELPTAAYKIWASSDQCGTESNEFVYIKNQ
jgi:hypothetical protein